MWIDQRFAGNGDEVGLISLQYGLGLWTVEDGANRHRRDTPLASNCLGVRHLIVALEWASPFGIVDHRILGLDAARGAVD